MRTIVLLVGSVVIGCAPHATQLPVAGPATIDPPPPAGDPTLLAQQPSSPGPQPAPLPSPQPAPPQPASPTQPPPPQPQPPAPYPPQPYPPQPYPQPRPYPQPYPPPAPYPTYPPPQPYPAPPTGPSRLHDGEVIGDFAAVGALASVDILIRQSVDNGSAGSLIVLAGVAGGAGAGWLLADRYHIDAGSAHATTIGLIAGAANGALLIEPTDTESADDVVGLIFIGSAIGATGGFVYGQHADLTSGQATFVLDAIILGTSTAALAAIAGSRDGKFGNFENSTLAVGLDAGLIGGALIAPSLDWSPKRAKQVFASSILGLLVGGATPGLFTKRDSSTDEYNGDLIAGCMTAGLWGGFGLGVLLTRDEAPDPTFGKPKAKQTTPATPVTTLTPWHGPQGQLGVMASGAW